MATVYAWLEGLQPGWGARFTHVFAAHGLLHAADLARCDDAQQLGFSAIVELEHAAGLWPRRFFAVGVV